MWIKVHEENPGKWLHVGFYIIFIFGFLLVF